MGLSYSVEHRNGEDWLNFFEYMVIKFSKILCVAFSLLSSSAFAFNNNCSFQWVTSNIDNLKMTLAQISTRSNIPVLFPGKYPFSKENPKILYVSDTSNVDINANKAWQISIDATSDCHGTKVCNIGSLTAVRELNIDQYYVTLPNNQKHAKEKVFLKNGLTGYYTPFHIEAGGINPTLEWKENGIGYTLRWRIDAEPHCQKQALVDMVNLANGHGKGQKTC